MNALPLPGLDGSNPLAFLAALGAYRILAESQFRPNLRLTWERHGYWVPVLTSDATLGRGDADAVVEKLGSYLSQRSTAPEFCVPDDNDGTMANDIKIPPFVFRKHLENLRSGCRPTMRLSVDFAAAFASEFITEKNPNKKRDEVVPTAFHLTSGRQQFLDMARKLSVRTKPGNVRHALFEIWKYEDGAEEDREPSLRWDPRDQRLYALQAYDPTDNAQNPIRTVRAANCLAVEALPLFPSFACATELKTTGFCRRNRRECFTWPVWSAPTGKEVLKTLLALPELQAENISTESLKPRGISAVFRSEIVGGYYGNMAPSTMIQVSAPESEAM